MEYPALRVPLQVVSKTAPYNSHSKAVVEMLDAVRAVLESQGQQLQDMAAELEGMRERLASLTPPTTGE